MKKHSIAYVMKISNEKFLIENIKTLFYALIITILIRSILFNLFIYHHHQWNQVISGDRLFVTKFSYGYSKHSFPFSPPIFKGRILNNNPQRGDVVVFKTPADNRTDYIKRLIGLPGDTIQFINGDLYLNNNQILKTIINDNDLLYCGNSKISVSTFKEKLSNGIEYKASYRNDLSFRNSDKL